MTELRLGEFEVLGISDDLADRAIWADGRYDGKQSNRFYLERPGGGYNQLYRRIAIRRKSDS